MWYGSYRMDRIPETNYLSTVVHFYIVLHSHNLCKFSRAAKLVVGDRRHVFNVLAQMRMIPLELLVGVYINLDDFHPSLAQTSPAQNISFNIPSIQSSFINFAIINFAAFWER